jgi:hypothetical protein
MRATLLVTCALLLACVVPVRAQVGQGCDGWQFACAPRWTQELAFLGANGLIAGVGAGTVQWARGGSFQDGFTRGVAGGVIAYGGKRVAVERFDGAGLIGRQVGALGASITANAAEGRASFERLAFPLGPLELEVHHGEDRHLNLRVDAYSLGAIVYGILKAETRFDLAHSLSAGTVVFVADEYWLRMRGERWGGTALGSTVIISSSTQFSDISLGRRLAHERVHVLQHDFIAMAFGKMLEEWLLRRVPGGTAVNARVSFSVLAGALNASSLVLPHARRPGEVEAFFLSGRYATPGLR